MWDPTLPGANEARTDAILAALQGNLAQLNTALTRDSLWTYTVLSSHLRKGDVDDLPDYLDAPILLCIEGAENDDRLFLHTMQPSNGMGWRHDFATNIFIYPHPDALPETQFVAIRERLIERVIDWAVTGTLNKWSNRELPMQSREYYASPANDSLSGGVVEIRKDWFAKSYGGTLRVRGAKLVHQGNVG